MTMLFSIATPQLITMTVDSTVTREFSDGSREYDTGLKAFAFPEIGCVTMWGARDGNLLEQYLASKKIKPGECNVESLAALVHTYLNNEYRPCERGVTDVGYHIAGFDESGKPRLFHVFWEANQPSECRFNDHSPSGKIFLLYNGRNDLAYTVIDALIKEIKSEKPARFNPANPIHQVKFGDFVARFAAEITLDVGPPFQTFIIASGNRIASLRNKDLCSLDEALIWKKLLSLGVQRVDE